MLTIHHLGISQSERIVWLCEELGLAYELKHYVRDPVTRLSPPALVALHPLGAAPVITDGDLVLAESGAIMEYIIAKHGGGRLALGPRHARFRPRRAAASHSIEHEEALPKFKLKLTAERYAKLRATGADGSPQLREKYGEVVTDLVDKYEIVAKELRQDLQEWVDKSICGYFEGEYKCTLTNKQVLACQRKIAQLGKKLREELVRLYGQSEYQDIASLVGILSRARQCQPLCFRTKDGNRADVALQFLGQDICQFWVLHVQAGDPRPPELSKSSAYFRFAKYIYAFVGVDRSDQMIMKRLRAAEGWFFDELAHNGRLTRAEVYYVTKTTGKAFHRANGAAVVNVMLGRSISLDEIEACEEPDDTASQ